MARPPEADRVLRLYVLGLALVRRRRLANAKNPPPARPPRNGGSPLSAGIPRPELRQGLRAYRSAPSRKPNAQGQRAGKRGTVNGKRGMENGYLPNRQKNIRNIRDIYVIRAIYVPKNHVPSSPFHISRKRTGHRSSVPRFNDCTV